MQLSQNGNNALKCLFEVLQVEINCIEVSVSRKHLSVHFSIPFIVETNGLEQQVAGSVVYPDNGLGKFPETIQVV